MRAASISAKSWSIAVGEASRAVWIGRHMSITAVNARLRSRCASPDFGCTSLGY